MDSIKLTSLVRVLNVAFDIGGEKLNWATEVLDQLLQGECENQTEQIVQALEKIREIARQAGFEEVRVICESTGVYHRNLLQLAGRLGMRTNLVHGEAVAKYRSVQFSDRGKTDTKDPRAILTVAKVGRLVKHRTFDSQYAQLRELHRMVMRHEKRRRALKNELRGELRCLNPDLRMVKEVLFGPTGKAVCKQFQFNPRLILAAGRAEFDRLMKLASPQTKRATRDKIWLAAEACQRQQFDAVVQSIQAESVCELYAEIQRITRRIIQIEERMQKIYREIHQQNPRLPRPQKGVVSARLLSRLIAEIGPPEDFQTMRQLTRYAGLNLCERQSGTWRGKTTISRRGRSEIRYVLNLISLPLVRHGQLFGDYYWKKKEQDKMPGKKAMACVTRKLLKMFFGWSRSEEEFNPQRVFQALSERAA